MPLRARFVFGSNHHHCLSVFANAACWVAACWLAACWLAFNGLDACGDDSVASPASTKTYRLEPAATPVDNPLKGLVPYARPAKDRFPHSMEFNYVGLAKLVVGEGQYDWSAMEELLDDIASRGNQTVTRVYMEYPKKTDGIPKYLIDAGVKVEKWLNTNTAPFPPETCYTPDYEDPRTRKLLTDFIAAFGKKYDGDPRLAYITAGLLGTWGEWHTYPRDDLFASKETQALVLDAYEDAFRRTPVLLRYPAGPDHYAQADNASRPFGYHDDSFAWATLDTGKQADDWFYMPALNDAGSAAVEKWQTQPIGGEIRPELWKTLFDPKKKPHKRLQAFDECVRQTHVTWLMDTGMFERPSGAERIANATEAVRPMGYDLTVVGFRTANRGESTSMELLMRNRGVAPFYADWPTEIAVVDADGKIIVRKPVPEFAIRGILPGEEPTRLRATVDGVGALAEGHTWIMRVVNPMEGGKPLRFGNVSQDQHLEGWLTLSVNEVR